jgi:hypothetical protein
MDPVDMMDTLNAFAPAPYNNFRIARVANKSALSHVLVWNILKLQVAPIVLVFGSKHWMVACDFGANHEPAGYEDTSYELRGLFFKDPVPATFFAHAAHDNCGSGGKRGHRFRHITCEAWQNYYLEAWDGGFQAVCQANPYAMQPAPQEPACHNSGQASRTRPVSAQEAQQAAKAGLVSQGLDQKEPWKSLLPGTVPGTPTLVTRYPDDPQKVGQYYIVPFMNVDAPGVPIAVIIDAFADPNAGNAPVYEESVAVTEPGGIAHIELQMGLNEALLNPRAGNRPESEVLAAAGGPGGKPGTYPMELSPANLDLQQTRYMWKPVLESFSPFYPFLVVGNVKDGDQAYIRIDGEMFRDLNAEVNGS